MHLRRMSCAGKAQSPHRHIIPDGFHEALRDSDEKGLLNPVLATHPTVAKQSRCSLKAQERRSHDLDVFEMFSGQAAPWLGCELPFRIFFVWRCYLSGILELCGSRVHVAGMGLALGFQFCTEHGHYMFPKCCRSRSSLLGKLVLWEFFFGWCCYPSGILEFGGSEVHLARKGLALGFQFCSELGLSCLRHVTGQETDCLVSLCSALLCLD